MGASLNHKKKKRLRILGKILFVIYIGFIIYFLLFSDIYGRNLEGMQEYHYNFELFKEIKRFWYNKEQLGIYAVFTNLLGNVLIFVPFGFFMPMASKYRNFFSTMFYSFALSFCVETFQLLTKVGSFDVDDLVLNTLGGALGYIFFQICAAKRRKHDKKAKRRHK